jgi:hypothetical protein
MQPKTLLTTALTMRCAASCDDKFSTASDRMISRTESRGTPAATHDDSLAVAGLLVAGCAPLRDIPHEPLDSALSRHLHGGGREVA